MKSKTKTNVLIFTLLTVFFFSSIPTKVKGTFNNSNWHAGVATSTPEVDITYAEEMYRSTELNRDALKQTMTLAYKDGTNAQMGFQILIWFTDGGLDISTNTVLDWDKANYVEPTFFTVSYDIAGQRIEGRHALNGYTILNGSKGDYGYSKQTSGSDWYISATGKGQGNGQLGFIKFYDGSCYINAVTLSTKDYTYEGTAYKESRASFTVTIQANAGTDGDYGTIPATVSYDLVHNVTHNKYKYGVSMDWTAHKNFTTSNGPMNHNDDYMLVSADLLETFYGTFSTTDLKQYSTNSDNSTTVYKNTAGETILTQYLPLKYNVTGGASNLDTYRYYFEEGRYEPSAGSGLGSNMHIIYDGFNWNVSTGIIFDPVVVTPCTLQSPLLMIVIVSSIVGAIALVGIVVFLKKRK